MVVVLILLMMVLVMLLLLEVDGLMSVMAFWATLIKFLDECADNRMQCHVFYTLDMVMSCYSLTMLLFLSDWCQVVEG